MRISLQEILNKIMLNRRILRIKAFKVLYSSVLSGSVSLSEAEAQLDMSCEATRDLYVLAMEFHVADATTPVCGIPNNS